MQRKDDNCRTARTDTGDGSDQYTGDYDVLHYNPCYNHLDDCRQVRLAGSFARASTD